MSERTLSDFFFLIKDFLSSVRFEVKVLFLMFICLFIFDCAAKIYLCCCTGFFLVAVSKGYSSVVGLVILQYVGSSKIRDQNGISCISRQILLSLSHLGSLSLSDF